jgi:hypothetical protein
MSLQPTNPSIGVNLSRLRDAFDAEQFNALESIFRTFFRNVENNQQTTAKVVNSNADAAVYTAGSGIDITSNVISSRAFPVGAIYTSITGVNPATELGYGTWSAFGAGRVLVGYDSGQTEFDTVEEAGGAKTHTLTVDEMPAHSHGVAYNLSAGTGSARNSVFSSGTVSNTQSTGGGQAHNNLQPYIVVHFWKRTA